MIQPAIKSIYEKNKVIIHNDSQYLKKNSKATHKIFLKVPVLTLKLWTESERQVADLDNFKVHTLSA